MYWVCSLHSVYSYKTIQYSIWITEHVCRPGNDRTCAKICAKILPFMSNVTEDIGKISNATQLSLSYSTKYYTCTDITLNAEAHTEL